MQNSENPTSEEILKALLEQVKELADKEIGDSESGSTQTGRSGKNNRWKKFREQIEKTIKTVPKPEHKVQTNSQTLHLAITMAGAISAGAYTAGVMDYLLEVLDRWEKLKDKNDERVPKHNIKIEVLSGASAGGMTAAITALALHRNNYYPIKSFNAADEEEYNRKRKQEDSKKADRRELNPFYNSWVNLSADEMMPVLFQTGDFVNLANGKQTCVSVLNSDFVHTIASRAVRLYEDDVNSNLPAYVSDKLRLFVTLTNLDGFQKIIDLGKSGQNFVMTDHRDAVLFRFADYVDHKKENDGSIRVDFTNEDGTLLLRQAAMATGAFPIGLAYRTFTRQRHHVTNNILLKHLHGQISLPDGDYRATFIDGGMINNEPFELTEMLLRRLVKNDRLTNDPENFNSTILMIDPFPSEKPKFIPDTENNKFHPYGLFGASLKFFSVLRKQVLVKHNVIEDAFNKDNYSCFVIAPTRHKIQDGDETHYNGSRAIACGTLGGFGGFVEKEFREHDFYLGRINCKSFLQNHFRVPAGTQNPIFKDAYSEEAKENFIFTDEDTGDKYLPIIPDVNKLDKKDVSVSQLYENLKFPSYSPHKFERLKQSVKNRISYVFDKNVDFSGMEWYLRPFKKLYLKTNLIVMRSVMFDKLSEAVQKDFDKWEMKSDKPQEKKSPN